MKLWLSEEPQVQVDRDGLPRFARPYTTVIISFIAL